MHPVYRSFRFAIQWIFILYARGRVFGVRRVPIAGPALLACNHQSFFDPMIAGMPVPRECDYMARDTLFRNPYFKRLIAHLNAFPIKRGSADIGAIKETLRRLKRGRIVISFPEGTRTHDGSIGPVHAGIITLAKRAKCPIVPVSIEGAFDIWPRHRKLPGRATVWLEYGRPIEPGELADLDAEQCSRLLTRRLRCLHNGLRRRMGRPPLEYQDMPAP